MLIFVSVLYEKFSFSHSSPWLTVMSALSGTVHSVLSPFHTFLATFFSSSFPRLLTLSLPSVLRCTFPSSSYLLPPHPSLPPTVGKWHVARVPAWTATPPAAEAPPAPNSLALVVTWTSSRHLLPHRQHHLSCSPHSTSIRKMDRPTFSPVSCQAGAQARTGCPKTISKHSSSVMSEGRWNK